MKKILVPALSVCAAIMILFSCSKDSATSESSFQEKIAQLNSRYEGQSLESGKLDPKKVKHLLGADALGAVGFSTFFSVPIIGPYVTLWGAFGTSYYACSWCPPLRQMQSAIANGHGASVLATLKDNEALVVNNNKNPFNSLGQMHNELMWNVAVNDSLLITPGNELSSYASDYIMKTTTMTLSESEREDLIEKLEKDVLPEITRLTSTESIDAASFLENTDVTGGMQKTIADVHIFITKTEMTDSDFVNYLVNLENLTLNDNSLSQKDQDAMLRYVAVAKYSFAFWITGDNL